VAVGGEPQRESGADPAARASDDDIARVHTARL
jgi:hypothetical protein